MRKLSVIKGILIGSMFSAFLWMGAYVMIASFNSDEIPQEQIVEPKKSSKPIA